MKRMNRVFRGDRLEGSRVGARVITVVSVTLFAWIWGPAAVFADIEVKQLNTGIYYGAFPKTDADYAKLQACGVRHIIDMRSFRRLSGKIEQRRIEARGMFYERLAIGFYPTCNDTTARLMDRIVRQPCGPVYFHCTLGSDRTGLIVALYRVHHMNWPPCCAFNHWKRDQFNPKLKDLDRYFWRSVAGHVGVESSPAFSAGCCAPMALETIQSATLAIGES